MKNINVKQVLPVAIAFLVGTIMGKFIMVLALIFAVAAILGYGIYMAHKNGVFSK